MLKFIRDQDPNSTPYKEVNISPASTTPILSSHSIPAHASLQQCHLHQTGTIWLQLSTWMGSVSIKWSLTLKALQEKSYQRFISWHFQYSKKVTSFWKPVQVMWTTPELSKQVTSAETRNIWQTLAPSHQFMLYKYCCLQRQTSSTTFLPHITYTHPIKRSYSLSLETWELSSAVLWASAQRLFILGPSPLPRPCYRSSKIQNSAACQD